MLFFANVLDPYIDFFPLPNEVVPLRAQGNLSLGSNCVFCFFSGEGFLIGNTMDFLTGIRQVSNG